MAEFFEHGVKNPLDSFWFQEGKLLSVLQKMAADHIMEGGMMQHYDGPD